MFVLWGSFGGSDLQVACVWCVSSFIFTFFGGVLSCLSLSSLLQERNLSINTKTEEKQGVFNGFVCAGVSLATPPPQIKHPKETKQKQQKQKRKGLNCCGARKNSIKQKTPTPNKNWGKDTLLCGHHPKPSKTLI